MQIKKIQGDGFFISVATNSYGVETAIVDEKEDKFYILDGDHSDNVYVPAGILSCLAYFKLHEDEISTWSDPFPRI